VKWADLPLGQVVYVRGASAEALTLTLEPLPDDAPVVVIYYSMADRTKRVLVESILDQLEGVAIRLLPVWLPKATHLEGPQGGGVSAARALAVEKASHAHYFGPFLADLAEHGLRATGSTAARFAPEVRAVELSKILAECYGRTGVAILIDVPEELDSGSAAALLSASDWFAAHGAFGVWLTGARLPDGGRFSTITIDLPADVQEIIQAPPTEPMPGPQRGVVIFPPVEGMPRPDSPSETLLESELQKCPWATGRVWNRPYRPLPRFIIDLMWIGDWCAVEIDGREHRNRYQFERDRQRDVRLQTEGFAVLRFTDDEVLRDVAEVIERIEKFLQTRRTKNEGSK
jgi:very-short-patch-repair endonuclease